MLSRQHFQMIAETVATSPDRKNLAARFADRLAETNPRFDRARFMAAATTAPALVVQDFTREPSSVNGNPRYRLHFTDGTSALTIPDAGFAYGIGADWRGEALVDVKWRGRQIASATIARGA